MAESYITAAFRSSVANRVYWFTNREYLILDHANREMVNGPRLIRDYFPSLRGTVFVEKGIDCAFALAFKDRTEAFIFSGSTCAQINYAPGTVSDKIVKGPMTIAEMFPYLKGTVFESSVDAAFESTRVPEAYLFKGDQYVRINYGPEPHLVGGPRGIAGGFTLFKGTVFATGIDAAFSSHQHNQAYVFKGDTCARIYFTPGRCADYIIGGVEKIVDVFPSLNGTLPRKN